MSSTSSPITRSRAALAAALLALGAAGAAQAAGAPGSTYVGGAVAAPDYQDPIGGSGDGSGGAYVLCNVDDLAQARAIVATDPLVLQDCSDLTVHEWNTR